MGKDTFQAAAMFSAQAELGTINPTLDAFNIGSTQPTLGDGLVLGDADSGEGGSGLDVSILRDLREKAFVSGSFTRPPSDFLGELLDGLTFAFPFAGNRQTTGGTPADGEFQHEAGIEALLRACGLQGEAWAGGVGWRYFPGNIIGTGGAAWSSARVFFEGHDYHLRDLVGELRILFPPGGIAIATATLGGIVDSFVGVGFPAVGGGPDYEEQVSVSAPVVEGVGHFMGHLDTGGTNDVPRGFTALELIIANEIEDVPDSNLTPAIAKSQNSRSVSINATIFQDDDDADYFRQKLIETVGGADSLEFVVDTIPNPGSAPAVAYQIIGTNPEVRRMTPRKLGSFAAWEVELGLVDDAVDGELSIIFG